MISDNGVVSGQLTGGQFRDGQVGASSSSNQWSSSISPMFNPVGFTQTSFSPVNIRDNEVFGINSQIQQQQFLQQQQQQQQQQMMMMQQQAMFGFDPMMMMMTTTMGYDAFDQGFD